MNNNEGCLFCCNEENGDLYPKELEGYIFYAGYTKRLDVDAFDESETERIMFCPKCGRRIEW